MVRDDLILLCAGALMVAIWTGYGWVMASEPVRFSDRGEAPPVRDCCAGLEHPVIGWRRVAASPLAIDFWECVIVRWEPGTPPDMQCPAATE